MKNDQYHGRLRVALNCKDLAPVLSTLKELSLDHVDMMANRDIISLKDSPSNLDLVSGTIGFIKFARMATLLWVGNCEPSLLLKFVSSGVVVKVFSSPDQAIEYLSMHNFLLKYNLFRVVVDENTPDIIQFVTRVRLTFQCPILVLTQNLNDFEYKLHSFSFIKEVLVTETKEIESFGSMRPIRWGRPEMIFGKAKNKFFSGTLKVNSISAFNLSKKSEPFCVISLNQQRKEKSGTGKAPHPTWELLNWEMSFNSNEQVRIDVYDKGYHLLGYYEKIISDLVPFPISERFITRKVLQAKKATKTSSIILDISFEEGNPVKHFGRPLEESLAQSQVDKVLHITDMATIYIRKYIKTEGLFRLSGNSTRITELKTLLDKGIEVDLSVESIHDICSLYKLYFSELPDKLFPESLYSSYKKSAKSEETEKLQETSQLISKLPPENQVLLLIFNITLPVLTFH
eukprot:TRINITY_DN2626_c0_g2_i2.p1 TRINITY_DN2626_c0_g2~~TRINITY_DN2626_c0_g2_i2.p1  ORF type:complete len:458 (-),score=100.11 TRINITY_DN2626_c0_g2_i2:680-2053(-)